MASRGNISFAGKKILAPMVRIGTLPARLMALEYGADLVYTHEVIDHKILQCARVKNDMLGTIDYILPDETVVLRTCEQETERLIFQVGTCSAERALRVAEKIHEDVAGIDVNMGCPKEFSLKGGMGAALLKDPGKIRDILTTLVEKAPRNLTVTCKIRILSTLEETVALCKMIESCGVNAVAIHGRQTAERPRHPNHNDIIRAVAEALTIPVIANGGSREHIKSYEDIEKFRQAAGAASVMVARSAMWNLSIFRQQGLIPLEEILLIYLTKAIDYDFNITNVKYCLQNMLHEELETKRGKSLLAAATVREISELWQLENHYDETRLRWARIDADKRKVELELEEKSAKPAQLQVVKMDVRIGKRDFDGCLSPKQLLYEYTCKLEIDQPTYDTTLDPDTRLYSSVCTLHGQQYASTWSHMSKKYVEQACAAVALRTLGLRDGLISRPEDAIQFKNKNGRLIKQNLSSYSTKRKHTSAVTESKSEIKKTKQEVVNDHEVVKSVS